MPDLATDHRLVRSRAAGPHGLHVAVGVPIRSGNHLLGVLAIYGDRIEDPEDSLIGFLGGLAAHVGQFLERRRAEELEIDLARTKDEFITMVTHELRNPLTIITGTLGVLSDDLDTLPVDQIRRHLDAMAHSADRLAAMTRDVLDLARLEAGQPTVHPQPTDLGPILRDAATAARPAAEDKNLTLLLDLSDSLALHADGQRLRQVADNLLTNAVKYTPAGGRITVTAYPDPAGEVIVWTVADTGIGIPPADRPRLFRRFYRASTALDRRIPGTGLGLVVTRAILDHHHGTITVADHDGPGTTFEIRLPIKPQS